MTTFPETKFVVLTDNRSGSTWLMSMLNSLPHVEAQGELFLPRPRSSEKRWDSDFARPRFVETQPGGLSVRPFTIFAYLDALYGRPGSAGFKLMYAQLLRYPEILAYFIRHRVRVIHLVRRNHLDVVLSLAVKAQIGRAHFLSTGSRTDAPVVDLDTDHLIKHLRWLRQKQAMARTLLTWSTLPHIEIAYEDLVQGEAHFEPVWKFLSLQREGETAESSLVRIRTRGHRDVIGNYEEVRRTMARTPFAGLLE